MFSHFTLGSNDMLRTAGFYDAVMPALGQKLLRKEENAYRMYGPPNGDFPHLFMVRPFDNLPATWSNGFHIAFNAPTEQIVDDFYYMAMSTGGINEGPPGLREHYAADYYGAYVRDPDGNKLQAVCYTNGRTSGETGRWISHITLGHGNLARETRFYDAVFAALGIVAVESESGFESVGYGLEGCALPITYVQPSFDGRMATWGNGTHTAFKAATREAVNLFHQAALTNGGICDGPPGLRPQYSANYYAAYVRDPVGNKLQAVCRNPE